ncbi:nitrilase/cyanide hydratase and apolipoprotein N-acyltransferase [Halorubrum saccharovorum DSM 1137]|uniref:Nitrilase/cyanide hydratase and apolipoprotein N-acyltransferase n=1 Tax=Halorubrum saccharovorum DSM 1137 TaxID=1227484 RepID=M0DRK2_9EURY|nr:carbon-nitrogen family hydrolase [Halorubrum saccharovorum]ELZ37312.1 nitrilase/cyanide hydratase and apolipoprotein N-acyltransferase [Halorubrum saccharovorum DSM 1137]
MRVVCVQLGVEGGAVEDNVAAAIEATREAAANGADLVVLPELFDVGYFAFESYARAAQGLAGDRLGRFAAVAGEEDVNVLAGTVVEDLAASAAAGVDVPADEGLANTAVLFDRSGDRRLVYRKRHLFGYGSEETTRMVPGEREPVTEIEGVRVGVTTCYDLRFPEQFRRMVEAGVDCVLVPSAWPYPRVEHWRTLGRARAIENLAYVAAVNGSGAFGGDALCGRTTVYDPWGTTLASAGEEPTTVTAEVDPDRVAAVREEFPALRDRR